MAGKPQKEWRRRKELLLGITHPEDSKKKWAISQAIKRRDEELIAEEEDIKSRGYCPHCYVVRTANGACTTGCG